MMVPPSNAGRGHVAVFTPSDAGRGHPAAWLPRHMARAAEAASALRAAVFTPSNAGRGHPAAWLSRHRARAAEAASALRAAVFTPSDAGRGHPAAWLSRHRARAAEAASALRAVMPRRPALLAALLLAPILAQAAIAPEDMLKDPAQEARAREIGRELRCMVCQNQSIEDSDAGLARDLRLIVREQVTAGRSDEQVVDYIHARYGDFVLLRPPFNASTALLWASPLVVLLLGGGLIFALRRGRGAITAPDPLTPAEQARLAALEAELAARQAPEKQ